MVTEKKRTHSTMRFWKQNIERIIIFTTEENLMHLAHNGEWIRDGTFAVAPKNFEQLFKMQSRNNSKTFHYFLPYD